MKALWITGADGYVGTWLLQWLLQHGYEAPILACTHRPVSNPLIVAATLQYQELDICNQQAMAEIAQRMPPFAIVNLAAVANVDLCESLPERAAAVNSAGPHHLALLCRTYHAHLIHLSTDHVFPGTMNYPGPYGEEDVPYPINWYGQTKLKGEQAIQHICQSEVPYTIVRASQVYGYALRGRANFVSWLLNELTQGQTVHIAADQSITPIYVEDLVQILCWLLDAHRYGLYHVAGPQVLDRYTWAKMIAHRFGFAEEKIQPVLAADFKHLAPRPLLGGLLCRRLVTERVHGAPQPRGIEHGLVSYQDYAHHSVA